MDGSRRWKLYFVHALTFGRIPLVLFFLVINVFACRPMGSLCFSAAFICLIAAAVTDMLDGYFARKLKVVTRFGAYADPLTDKIFYLTVLPTLVYLSALKGQNTHAGVLLVLTVLFLARDQWVSFLRSVGAIHGAPAEANFSGKLRTLISFPVICVIYYYLQAPGDWALQISIMGLYGLEITCMLINVLSIGVYTVQYRPWLKKEF